MKHQNMQDSPKQPSVDGSVKGCLTLALLRIKKMLMGLAQQAILSIHKILILFWKE